VTTDAERKASAVARMSGERRHRARAAAVQMLYQWEVGRISMLEVRQTFWGGPAGDDALSEAERTFATTLADGVAGRLTEIDPIIAEAAEHWRIERMNVMDRLILRLAVYEFLSEPQTPARVIINEALELARTFSNDDAVRFVNGILDGIRKKLGRE
jgi:N utilization substance protein B